jgi:hypothetical protein
MHYVTLPGFIPLLMLFYNSVIPAGFLFYKGRTLRWQCYDRWFKTQCIASLHRDFLCYKLYEFRYYKAGNAFDKQGSLFDNTGAVILQETPEG